MAGFGELLGLRGFYEGLAGGVAYGAAVEACSTVRLPASCTVAAALLVARHDAARRSVRLRGIVPEGWGFDDVLARLERAVDVLLLEGLSLPSCPTLWRLVEGRGSLQPGRVQACAEELSYWFNRLSRAVGVYAASLVLHAANPRAYAPWGPEVVGWLGVEPGPRGYAEYLALVLREALEAVEDYARKTKPCITRETLERALVSLKHELGKPLTWTVYAYLTARTAQKLGPGDRVG